jgi:hypothetical protein
MSVQSDEMKKAADAAGKSAAAAIDANKNARDNFRQDQRPYVWLTNFRAPDLLVHPDRPNDVEGHATWSFHYTNYGKSPAYHVSLTHVMEIGDKATTRRRNLGQFKTSPPIPPNKDDFTTAVSRQRISQSEFTRLRNTENAIMVFGQFKYSDSSGSPYATDFCFLWLRTGAVAYCSEGNDIR